MQAAARALFREKLAPAQQCLAEALDERANKVGPFWGTWPAHAATAAATVAVTWFVAMLDFAGH